MLAASVFRVSIVPEATGDSFQLMHPLLASFVDLEDRNGAEALREAVEQRRYGKRTMNFNCFDVIIDADRDTVELQDSIGLDGARAVIPANEVLDALRRL